MGRISWGSSTTGFILYTFAVIGTGRMIFGLQRFINVEKASDMHVLTKGRADLHKYYFVSGASLPRICLAFLGL